MIVLNNISKTYTSKAKRKVHALRNVSLQLDSCGMVFILGKSGSGKSTLLNLLGGLDAPSGGVITVDGVSMEKFKQSDYDAYRNGYVGFVFQEFNLLADFNVRDNVALALRLGNGEDVDQKAKDALSQVELPEEYLTRRVGELSGGERQRVAIARCIVKDCKFILADEPTCNLDSVTGESVWNILKKLSETKLVVVVSHDQESAEKYGDRIVEIADGEIIADNGAQPQAEDEAQKFTPQKKRLDFKTCLKMGANSMWRHKWRAITVILLSILTILALLITQMSITFSEELTYAEFIKQKKVPYFSVRQGYCVDGEFYKGFAHLSPQALEYFDNNADYIVNGAVKNKQQLLDFGFNFVGDAMELTPNSYYLNLNYVKTSGFMSSNYKGESYYVDDNGKKIMLQTHSVNLTDLVGKQVYCDLVGMAVSDNPPFLAGIIDVNENDDLYVPVPSIFTLKNFESRGSSNNSFLTFNKHDDKEYSFNYGTGSFSDEVEVFEVDNFADNRDLYGKLLTPDGQFRRTNEIREGALNDGEIILSFEFFQKVFGAKSENYYVGDVNNIRVPAEMGQKFDFKIYDVRTGKLVADLGQFKLVGLVTSLNDCGSITLNGNGIKAFLEHVTIDSEVLIRSSSVTNLSNFILGLSKFNVYVANIGTIEYVNNQGQLKTKECTDLVEDFNSLMVTFRPLVGISCAILAVVLILMAINLISSSITSRKKEIGILAALGANNRDITRIFIFETLVISVICFVLTLVLAFVFAAVFNAVFCQSYSYKIPFFKVDIFVVLTLIASSFGLLLLAALIPIRKIVKLKPIDAIRHV